MEGLTFEPEGHVYRWNGQPRPSVTQVLTRCHSFGFLKADVLEAAQDRGTYVHSLCEADDLNDLNEDAERGGEFFGYLLGWRKFVAAFKPNFAAIEVPMYSTGIEIAGTPDRLCGCLESINTNDQWILDIKSSTSKHKVWGMQLAAYRRIAQDHMGSRWLFARRASVRLTAEGSFHFDEYASKKDLGAFLGLVQLLDWETSP